MRSAKARNCKEALDGERSCDLTVTRYTRGDLHGICRSSRFLDLVERLKNRFLLEIMVGKWKG